MKIGDKVIVINPLYAQITNGAVGTIVSEYIPNSQCEMYFKLKESHKLLDRVKSHYVEQQDTRKEDEWK